MRISSLFKRLLFTHCMLLALLSKISWLHMNGFIYGLSILFCLLVFLTSCQCYSALITAVLHGFEIRKCEASSLLLQLRLFDGSCLVSWTFGDIPIFYKKKLLGFLYWLLWNLYITMSNMKILITLALSNQKHAFFLFVYVFHFFQKCAILLHLLYLFMPINSIIEFVIFSTRMSIVNIYGYIPSFLKYGFCILLYWIHSYIPISFFPLQVRHILLQCFVCWFLLGLVALCWLKVVWVHAFAMCLSFTEKFSIFLLITMTLSGGFSHTLYYIVVNPFYSYHVTCL